MKKDVLRFSKNCELWIQNLENIINNGCGGKIQDQQAKPLPVVENSGKLKEDAPRVDLEENGK